MRLLYQKTCHFLRSVQDCLGVPDTIHQQRNHHPTFYTINNTNSFSSSNTTISNNSSTSTNSNTVPRLIFCLGCSPEDDGVT